MTLIHDLGKKGENLAANYLINKGYRVLSRNFRYRKAEIDIIARKEDTLAMIEVKTRNESFYEGIAETISIKKRNLIVSAADHYVTVNALDLDVRFDVITLIKKDQGFLIEHIPDAFYHF